MKQETKDKIIAEYRREIAIKGGQSTLKKYGKKYFKKMAIKREKNKRSKNNKK